MVKTAFYIFAKPISLNGFHSRIVLNCKVLNDYFLKLIRHRIVLIMQAALLWIEKFNSHNSLPLSRYFMFKETISALIQEQSNPSVTISLATHKTHPQNLSDRINLKNLINDAKERLSLEFGDREIAGLLTNLDEIETDIDHNYNNNGLYIFLSDKVKKYVRTSLAPLEDRVNIDEQFALRDLIRSDNRTEKYYILSLSQGAAVLYAAENDKVIEEISNEDFPFQETSHIVNNPDEKSNAHRVDSKLKEYFNTVDKALVKVVNENGLPVVVISTRSNYDDLLSVADRPKFYLGGIALDYNNSDPHQLAVEAWKFVEEQQEKERADAITEIKEAISSGKVLTDLQEIWQAAKNGQGDLLLVNSGFKQAVILKDDQFDYSDDPTAAGVTDDIVNDIAWDVLSKNGRVYFTSQTALDELGPIALKLRY